MTKIIFYSAQMEKERLNLAKGSIHSVIELGGEGSGNYGHAGRPGEVGGSDTENQPKKQENKSMYVTKKTKERDFTVSEKDIPKKNSYSRGDYNEVLAHSVKTSLNNDGKPAYIIVTHQGYSIETAVPTIANKWDSVTAIRNNGQINVHVEKWEKDIDMGTLPDYTK